MLYVVLQCGYTNVLYISDKYCEKVLSISPLFHCNHSLIACFQHSNHLGPLSEEWKHVSQVKPVSYFPYTISLLTYFCCYLSVSCVFVFVFVCVGACRRRHKK